MKIGISTACLYPMETSKALETLVMEGVDFFEVFFNTISEIEEGYLKEINLIAKSNNSEIISLHPFTSGYEPYLLFSSYITRYKDTLEFYKKYFNAANLIGASIIVIHGDRKRLIYDIEDEEYFERFAALARIGREFGVTVAQENVNAFKSQDPAFLEKMRNYLKDEAKFVLDIKQAVRSGKDPKAVARAMGEGICHLHLNDNNENSDCLLPGNGTMDYADFFELISEFGYDGDAVIEVYRHNFEEKEQLINSYNTFKNNMKNKTVNE